MIINSSDTLLHRALENNNYIIRDCSRIETSEYLHFHSNKGAKCNPVFQKSLYEPTTTQWV